ncbi:FAD-dependent monooxygenase [Streptomyces syringium]|uniref:FAD-dependent monooxygenase n=1 Tax=Streptomyces syringium TaxID=76729 RepID=UPI0034524BFC
MVIGAGIAGLLAARVLSETFQQVTVIERDLLPADPQIRKGVPQGRHAHALQARGAEVFEELFPGLRHELTEAGAPPVDCCAQARLQLPSGHPAPVASGILLQPCSRPLLETTVRHRVARLPGVRIQDARTVTALIADMSRRRVTGVNVTRRAAETAGRSTTTLTADLVVDASGRSSHLTDWLTALGMPRPAESMVDARVGYASRTYRTRPGDRATAEWLVLLNPPQAPDTPRGCFALHIEDDQLLVTLQGAGGDHPPTAQDAFTAFTSSLGHNLADLLSPLKPVSAIHAYRHTANRRRHCHRLRRWPDGLIALGDAVCVFNPVYAQGMAVAALEASALRTMLARYTGGDLRGFARRYQRRLARITAWPWLLATLGDTGWQAGAPSPITRAAQWYFTQWIRRLPQHQDMHVDFIRMTNMLVSPAVLVHPRHLARILLPSPRKQAAVPPASRPSNSSLQQAARPHDADQQCPGNPAGPASSTFPGPPETLALLQALRCKGAADEEAVAVATALPQADVSAWLEALCTRGDCARTGTRLRLTPAGRQRRADLLTAERRTLPHEELQSLEAEFDPVNAALKELLTAWQFVRQDSTDPGDITGRLSELHRRARPVVERLAATVPRLAPFPHRLDHAAAQVAAGDPDWLASPLRDSYHTVWFEFHQELLDLTGTDRTAREKTQAAAETTARQTVHEGGGS